MASSFPTFISVYLCSSVDSFPSARHWPSKKKITASAPSQGVVAGMKRFAALYGGATGGDERRHIASARPRGSEGAPAISIDPLRNPPPA
jgi:hypothetical protein